MNLQQLKMLREVATLGTISAAASSLNFTPSAVSQQLASLEKSTGVDVLERVGRNVRLTDAGRELVRHADELLNRMEAAQSAIERVNDEVTGTLEVAVYESVAGTLLPPLLLDLSARYPDLVVRSRQTDPDRAIEMLQRGELDLAFVHDHPGVDQPVDAGIDRVQLIDDRFHVVVDRNHPLSSRATVELTDLTEERFIGSSSDDSCGRFLFDACHRSGFVPDVAHELNDYPTELRLVAVGQGVGLVPDLAMQNLPDEVAVLTLEPPLYRVVGLAFRTSSAERPAITAFCDAAKRIAATRT